MSPTLSSDQPMLTGANIVPPTNHFLVAQTALMALSGVRPNSTATAADFPSLRARHCSIVCSECYELLSLANHCGAGPDMHANPHRG